MGSRANLLLVDEQGYKLFYCHWCAQTIPKDLFWGPEYAIPFIQNQRAEGEEGWLDDVWAEGGAVVDTYRRVVLLYGGEDILYDIPLRRLYLALLREVWRGWEIRWAEDGIFEMADYVGVPQSKVQSERDLTSNKETQDHPEPLEPPEELDWTDVVGTILFENGLLRHFPLAGNASGNLRFGKRLLENANENDGFDHIDLREWTQTFPQGGFFIDIAKHQVAYWDAYGFERIDNLKSLWLGWEVIWWRDRYEQHLERTGNTLILPTKPIESLLADLESSLLSQSNFDPRGSVHVLENAGHTVEVNPYFWQYDPQDLPLPKRRAIFDAAVAQWRKKNAPHDLLG